MIAEDDHVQEGRYAKKGAYATTKVREQEDAHEGFTGTRRPTATPLFTSLASALAHDQLRQMTCQPGQHGDTVTFQVRRLCGRWLTVQRLRCGITADMMADRVGVGADTLQLLELGLANDLGANDDRWAQLALLLADPQHDADFVMAALRAALDAEPLSPTMLERVVDDMRPEAPTPDDEA